MINENMRVNWFEHVRKTRKKLSKGLKQGKLVPHREAMKAASQTWPAIKGQTDQENQQAEEKANQKGYGNAAEGNHRLGIMARQKMFFHAVPCFFRVFLHIRNIFIMLIKHRTITFARLFMLSVVLIVSEDVFLASGCVI